MSQWTLCGRPYALIAGVSIALLAVSLSLLTTFGAPSDAPAPVSSAPPSEPPSSPLEPPSSPLEPPSEPSPSEPPASPPKPAAMSPLVSVEFEVFGRVQGVFFRKYTQRTARELGLVGWCLNTRHDTVQGHVQGAAEAVARMKRWLREKGSPQSKIDRVEFHNEHNVAEVVYKEFSVRH